MQTIKQLIKTQLPTIIPIIDPLFWQKVKHIEILPHFYIQYSSDPPYFFAVSFFLIESKT